MMRGHFVDASAVTSMGCLHDALNGIIFLFLPCS
jgi:hypothetical protein